MTSIRPKQLLSFLKRKGFYFHHQRGSHMYLKHPNKSGLVTLPIHNKDLKPGTLKSILKQVGISKEELFGNDKKIS